DRCEQLLCQRFHVALRDGAKQNELEHFVIADRLAAGREKPLPQALAMAVVMRRLVGGRRRCRRFVALGHRAVIRAARLVAPASRARMPAPSDFAMAANRGGAPAGGRGGDRVKIWRPASVTATVCSNWAESERSRVTAVQPSESTFTCGRPRLIIGSTVKNMPGRSMMPSPGRPTCTMLGSSWNRRPTP